MLLEELCGLNGVSSRENEVRDYIRQQIKGRVDELYTDALGNLIGVKGRNKGGPKVMLTAHMDEIGLMVLGIDKSGLLHIDGVGSVDERVLVSKTVVIGPNKVKGVIGAKPIHLQERDERNKPIPMKSLFVDIGAKDKEDAEKYISLGDMIAFTTKPESFGDGLFKAKSLDDRVGCAAVMRLIDMDLPFPVFFVFTVQEEVGGRGSRVAAYGIDPDVTIVFEGTSAGDMPDSKHHKQSTRLGKGPAITFMDRSILVKRSMVDRIVEVAKEGDIPYQYREMTTGGTDAGPVSLSREGSAVGVLSVPCRYIHSPVSVMDLSDFDNTVKLAGRFLKSIETKGVPA